MSGNRKRESLITELNRNRERVAGDLADLGDALNVSQRFHDSVRRHPAWWIGGGVAAGVILSRALWPRRRRRKGDRSDPARPVFLGLLGLAGKQILRLSSPALRQIAQSQIEDWLASRPPVERDGESTQPEESPTNPEHHG